MAEIKKLKKKRTNLKKELTNFSKFLGDNVGEIEPQELGLRLERAKKILGEYQNNSCELETLDENTDYSLEDEVFENEYYRCISLAGKILNGKQNNTLNNNEVPNVKLPTIELPVFDGSYEYWFQFRDTFSALIENNKNISDIQKFYYLNSCLKGKARQVIASMEVSEVTYKMAWALLKKRYENTKFITDTHVRCLFELPAVTKENGVALRNLIDKFLKHKGV